MSTKKKIGILGASGYTGADAVRLLARHPHVEITALTANTHAGKAMDEVFPHFFMLDLPRLTEWEKVDWTELDAVFCGLPHGTTQEIIAAVISANPAIKILDMSADFRLRDMGVYAQWYGHEHRAPKLQGEAVYGLTEFYREDIKAARLVACPGCYPTAALLALVPIAKAKLIDVDDIVIDAKSGVTGAGRFLALRDKPTAIFAASDEAAVGCIKALKDGGYAVPRDVSVAGFDGIDYSALYEPALTTVLQPRAELGRCAAENLVRRMDRNAAPEPPKRTRLQCTLVVRDSVAAPRAGEHVLTAERAPTRAGASRKAR